MKGKKLVKVAGLAATILGVGLTFVTNWVAREQMREEIADEVSRQLKSVPEEEESVEAKTES